MTTLSDVGNLVEDTADRIFRAHCGSTQLKAAEGSWSAELWAALAEAGLTTALEPEDAGELGVATADALNLVRLAGRHAAPVPLAESLLGNWLLRMSGLGAEAEPLTIAGLNPRDSLRLERSGRDWTLSGVAHRTPWARYCGLAAVVDSDEGVRVVRLPAGAFESAFDENMAREPRDEVRIEVAAPAASVAPCPLSLLQLRARAAAIRALQIAGAAERALELTAGYAKERVQFGRAIGKFQAVQQSIAVMGGQVAAARAAGDSVAASFEADDAAYVFAAAKIRAGEAAGIVARNAHQVHGAIGFTQEYELHFLTKRLWSWRDEYGNEAHWSRLLGDEVCRRGADAVWPLLTSGLRTAESAGGR